MHPLLIDWLRRIHLNADAALATKRWNLAEAMALKIKRKEVVQLLRAFMFSPSSPELIQTLTQEFLVVDKEFPASKNVEEVRLMAGVIMVAAFTQRTKDGDAFALGIKAATFPKQRSKVAQLGIVEVAAKYIGTEADVLRPSDFGGSDDREAIREKLEALAEAMSDAEDEPRKKACQELAETFHESYGDQLQRLAEETGLLWWLLGGYSSALNRETGGLDAEAYALIAAAEVAERTLLLPPPASIYAILGRALAPCKMAKVQKSTLKDFVNAAAAAWRREFVAANPAVDCADFVPFVTALAKTEEAGGTGALARVLPKTCPGVAANISLTPLEAARQFYNELIFLKALTALD